MYRRDIVAVVPDLSRAGGGAPSSRRAPPSSSWPSSACSPNPPCTAMSCGNGSTPPSARSGRSASARSTRHLRRLQTAGHIATEEPVTDVDAVPLTSRRSRVTYRITAEGKERLAELLGDAGPQSWSDDGFGVHLAFFSRTSSEARMRILEGRRRRVEERREGLRSAVTRAAERLDTYTTELHQLGLGGLRPRGSLAQRADRPGTQPTRRLQPDASDHPTQRHPTGHPPTDPQQT